MKKWYYAAAVPVAAMLIACGSTSEPSKEDNERLDNHTNSQPSVAAKNTTKQITAGTWEIGAKDNTSGGVITAGTYAITVPENGFYCMWQRVRNLDNEAGSIISMGNVEPGSVKKVNVKSSDKALILDGDCLAKKSK